MVRCGRCGRAYSAALFREGRVVMCECGGWVEREGGKAGPPAPEVGATAEETARARKDVDDLARRADRVTALILYSDLQEVDIEIAINELREFCRRHFPESIDLFRMVYESRWKRFREQGWARGHALPY